MTHLLVFLPALLGFLGLALAMDRHQRQLLGRELDATRTSWLRAGGWAALALSYLVAVLGRGAIMGSVEWVGHLTLAALLVMGFLTLRASSGRA